MSIEEPLARGAYDPGSRGHDASVEPARHWTRANVGEAMPGVQTPLSWSLWSSATEAASRKALHAIGALSRDELRVPMTPEDRVVRAFYGRAAVRVDFLTDIGDRMPGTSGRETAKAMLGSVPPGLVLRPTRRRYPAVVARFPVAFARTPRRCRAFAADTARWYEARCASVEDRDERSLIALFAEAEARFQAAVALQVQTLFASIQPLYEVLEQVVQRTGVGDVAVLSGVGGAESAVVSDIWRAAHGEIDLAEVQAAHGFHGPLEGELSSRVWREDPAPLERLLRHYAAKQDPRAVAGEAALSQMQAEVIRAAPRRARPIVAGLLRHAAGTIPLRGVAKRSFLQSFDVARLCARRLGRLRALQGALEGPEDIFLLRSDELPVRSAAHRDLVAARRDLLAGYRTFDLPKDWFGEPERIVPKDEGIQNGDAERVTGVGVSPGSVEGLAFVVDDPALADPEPDSILVARTTDPSWSSLMFISSGLVVDIGGVMSHAAVVAREMGIPCVVGTEQGTRVIRTGDRLRIDGTTGVVELMERAARA